MFKRLLAFLLFIAAPALAFAQQSPVKTFVGDKGFCMSLLIAGRDVPCSDAKGLTYMLLANGKVILTLGFDDGKSVISFVGAKDSQPNPTDYFLYLSNVDIITSASRTTIPVGGECKLTMSVDGQLWHSLSCTSEDANSTAYALNMIFGSNPVKVLQQ